MYIIIGKKKTAASKFSKKAEKSNSSSSSSGEDKVRVSARVKLGEVDVVPEIVETVVQSSKQVIGADLSEAGAVLECYRVTRWLSVYLLIAIL
jgi:hypothetical protein